MSLTFSQTLSKAGIDAMMDATAIGKDKLGDQFYSSCVTRLLKSGYWANIEDKAGRTYKLRVKTEGSLKTINFK